MASVPLTRHLLRARDFASLHHREPITVEDMAGAAGLSRSHFSREFSRAFGESPSAFLRTRRLERAADLLRRTDHSVARICMEAGFTSIGSFTASFGRAYRVTPTQYRAAFEPAASWAMVPSCLLSRLRPAAVSRTGSTSGEDTATG